VDLLHSKVFVLLWCTLESANNPYCCLLELFDRFDHKYIFDKELNSMRVARHCNPVLCSCVLISFALKALHCFAYIC